MAVIRVARTARGEDTRELREKLRSASRALAAGRLGLARRKHQIDVELDELSDPAMHEMVSLLSKLD